MNRQQILSDMKQTLGSSPDFLTGFPDQVLEHVWMALKDFELGQTAIPNKYKELMGLAVAAQMQCPYCIYFHTETAKLMGATEEEVREALGMAMMTAGLSSYIAGSGHDLNKFKQECQTVFQHVQSHMQQQRKAA